jgi:hypothetical protein
MKIEHEELSLYKVEAAKKLETQELEITILQE